MQTAWIIFTTAEPLQPEGDVNEAPDVYLWHDGTVSMVSDGHSPRGVDVGSKGATNWPAISATGSDVFFTTETELVPQDTDDLQDLYDARVLGGIAQPLGPEACSGESCLSKIDLPEPFGPAGSIGFTGAGNLTPAAAASAQAKASGAAHASVRPRARASVRRVARHSGFRASRSIG